MKSPINGKYFLTAIHRQENLMSRKFMKNTFEKIFDLSESMKCVFIYHVQTESALKNSDYGRNLKSARILLNSQGRTMYRSLIML